MFKTIHTTYGLAAMAQAEATGTPINLTHMAVGDGNGNPVSPTEGQPTLVRELFRAAVNRVFQDPSLPNRYTAELVIPATEGGFVLREVGVFDDSGSLFAVGNLPDTYKPMASEGAYADTVVRMEFLVTNAELVTLMIDPAVAVATQAWISNNVTAATIIPGGTTGQLLAKDSNADGDFVWQDPDMTNVVVDVIEETQTLAAAQTAVILTTCTTNGLALYIDGNRLRPDQWTAVDDTHLTLSTSYPTGTKLVAAQNEPAGSAVFPLARNQNLADVPSKETARANLDVFSKTEVRNMVPAGIVDHYAGQTPPAGWLVRDGSTVSRAAYADLFAKIGTTYGEGDGFNTFNLPDDRGLFDRGWDGGRGIDAGRTFGSYQLDALQGHKHSFNFYDYSRQVGSNGGTFTPSNNPSTHSSLVGDPINDGTNGAPRTAAETRPKNRAYLPIIKY